jgi:hypothetical protein
MENLSVSTINNYSLSEKYPELTIKKLYKSSFIKIKMKLPLPKTARAYKQIITNFIRLTLIIALVGAILNFSWTVLFVTLLTLALTFLPYAFEKRYDIDIPEDFEIIAVLFIYATLFLGEIHGYYQKYIWWDVALHGLSAFAFGLIGFTVMYILYRGDKIKARPITIALFAFSFAVMIGAIWEILEFLIDQIFGTNMQKSGLVDTITDLIVDVIGALLASAIGFTYLKTNKTLFFGNSIRSFEENNPRFFKAKKIIQRIKSNSHR